MKRPSRFPFLLVALAILLVGLALVFVGVRLATPFTNGRLWPGANAITAGGVVVTPLATGPQGFQEGDVVTAVDGRSLQAWLVGGPRQMADRWQDGNTISFTVIREGAEKELPITLAPYPLGAILRLEWGTMSYYTLFLLIAVYVFLRRPHLITAQILFLGAAAQFSAMPWSLGLQVSDFVDGTGIWLYHLSTIGGFMLAWIAFLHFALVFPRPTGLISKKRWVLPLMYGLPYLLLALYLLFTRLQATNLLHWMGRWQWFTGPHAFIFISLSFVTIIWQYRRSRGATRQQIRWLVLATLVVAGSAVLFYFLPSVLGDHILDANVMGLIGVLFPLAVAISILRHHLFDIDTLLNRAFVYGVLTAVIVTLYVLVVGVLGTVLQARGNLFVALAATGLTAILFQPLRDRLQKTVNRFMYGERDEPFEVLARLGERLESTLSPERVYPTIVETVSQALKLPYVAVTVWHNGQWQTAESYGKAVANPVTYPLTYQGEQVGQLLVAQRAPDEAFGPADERILRNIARQAGAAVHAVQLMVDLQQSRQQLVTAREEERRRLRRDLHDGLGPQLASQTLTIDAIDKLLARDPQRARALLHDLKVQSQAAVQDIRQLVYDLRPPALDEFGLAGALRESATRQSQNGLRMTVDVPAPLPLLPAAVGVAAYRVAQEAMTNVVRHAQATACTVRLALMPRGETAALCVEITDDGRGLPSGYRAGVGLQSMRERTSELGGTCHIKSMAGGGTRVTAVLPLPATWKQHLEEVSK